jgi:hypothetical protein
MEDSAIKPYDNVEEKKEDYKQLQPLKHELFDEEYDVDVLPMPRKGKNIIKRRSDKNMKKNKVKQNGYADKLDMVEVNLPTIWDPDFDWHEFYSEKDDDYYSDNESYDYYEYVSSPNYYYYSDNDSLDEWNNANRTGRGWD